ncbi:MAG: hypothetical protein AB7U46_01775 [Paenirhodobacter sp.]|uniref:hypothetical protein n=1 Tax=Paenirhodobacter sp. TaxID=1965326 RepID=UPI003D1473B1
MRNVLASTAFALALSAGAASAGGANAGIDQIAHYLGVNAGAYSSVELHQLLAARNAGDQSTYAYLLAHGDRSSDTAATAGKEQLAAQAGLNANDYTAAELIRVRDAQLRGDLQEVNFVVSHQNRNSIVNPQVQVGRDS